jgi:predicted PurR-regulated permease PerM
LGEFALIVAILALGRPVLVPVTLAFYLAFVLTPPCDWLERAGAPRPVALTAVVGAALALVAGLSSVLIAQAADLAGQLKTYSKQVSEKLTALRSGVLTELSGAVAELGRMFEPDAGSGDPSVSVRVVSGGLSAFRSLEQAVGPLLEPLAVLLLVIVMAVFMLANRDDLRGRLIQLTGPENVTLTTRTLAEAVNRVSHVLLTQAYINVGFGIVISAGLYLIGIPYAALWGALAGALRFVPLLGTVIAVLLPSMIAFAVFPGWREVLLTVAFFGIADVLVANFVDPVVLGRRTGVSALALLISALFWTWLWGPLGLVLATPLTVCAAVLGRHVPQLQFLSILLGEQTSLNADLNFYQRILARAAKDAYLLAKARVHESSLAAMFDELMIPALRLMVHDQNVNAIDQGVADRVVKTMGDIVARLSRAEPRASHARAGSLAVLGVPAESVADQLLLEMLQTTLPRYGEALNVMPPAERQQMAEQIVRLAPSRLCVAALPPSGNANARFLCRRLRAQLPELFIVVLSPEAATARSREAAARLREAGANEVVYGLREAGEVLLAHARGSHGSGRKS